MVAQSASFSNTDRGSPAPGKRANRVPPVPTPQLGKATPNAATFPAIVSISMLRRASRAPSAS